MSIESMTLPPIGGENKKEETEANWQEETKEKVEELKSESSFLGNLAEKAGEQIEKLSKSDKLKFLNGISELGYRTTEFKSGFFEKRAKEFASLTNGSKFLNTYFNKEADIYAELGERAKEARENIDKKDLSRLSGLGQGMGNFLRYGRIAFDAGVANPFRHVMAASMFVGRRGEALKETRLEYEGAKENTRVKDVDRAMEEAWDLYEQAQKKSGTGEVDSESLAEAYKKNLPKDIEKRFQRADYVGMTFIEKGMNRHLKWAADRLANKLEKIESSNITEEEKQEKRNFLLSRNEKLINDLDRMVGDEGMIDNLSYYARAAEKGGKTVAMAMTIESIPRLARLAPKLGEAFTDLFVGEAHGSELDKEDLLAVKDKASFAAENAVDTKQINRYLVRQLSPVGSIQRERVIFIDLKDKPQAYKERLLQEIKRHLDSNKLKPGQRIKATTLKELVEISLKKSK